MKKRVLILMVCVMLLLSSNSYTSTQVATISNPHKWDLNNILLFSGEKWIDGGSSKFTYEGHKAHIITSKKGVKKTDVYTLPVIIDLSKRQYIEIIAYCANVTKIKNMVLCLYDGSKYAQYNCAEKMKDANSQRWRRLRIRSTDFTYNNGFSSINWSHITQLQQYLTATTGNDISVAWASVSALNIRPVITINFDDGYENVYTNAKAIMDKYKFKGIAYVIPSYVGKAGFMSVKQIKELVGWDIGCHTYNHINLRDSKESTIRSDLKAAGEWFKQNAFTEEMNYIAAPGGNYSNEKFSIYNDYCNVFRGNRTDGLSYSILPSYRSLIDGHWFSKYQSIYNTDSVSSVKTWIDEVIANGYHWNITFHQITNPADASMKYSLNKFDAVMAYLSSKRDKGYVDILLPSEIYN